MRIDKNASGRFWELFFYVCKDGNAGNWKKELQLKRGGDDLSILESQRVIVQAFIGAVGILSYFEKGLSYFLVLHSYSVYSNSFAKPRIARCSLPSIYLRYPKDRKSVV